MYNISTEGALLETDHLNLGEDIRVEIGGDCAAFTVDAIVVRSCSAGGVRGFGVRFVDRDPNHYADWLHEEWNRMAMWLCRDNDPLIATSHPVVTNWAHDPAYIPVHPVLQMIKFQPGTSLDDLLSLESYNRLYIRIAVARLIESGTLMVMGPAAEGDAPATSGLISRIWESMTSSRAKASIDARRSPVARTNSP
jgi:hypothetical protein